MVQANIESKLGKLKGKKILVTGGLGFLGKFVVEAACNYEAQVIIVDNSQKPSEAQYVKIDEDILESSNLESLIKNVDYVVHLAGSLGTDCTFSDLTGTVKNNVLAGTIVLEHCLKHNRRAVLPTVGNNWRNPYTITKNCTAELAIMANTESFGDFRILKIMNIYGPRQVYNNTKKIIPAFFRSCILKKPVEIYGDGNQCVDLIYVEDAALAVLLACVVDNIPNDKYLDIGTFIPHRVIEAAEMVQEMVNPGSKLQLRVMGKRKGEPLHSITLATDDTFRIVTGFEATTDFHKGLELTYRWYKENLHDLQI